MRYEILGRLGGGGMADLFLAKLVGPGGFERQVAVKRLAADRNDDPAAMTALFDEARIAARLSHANIVQVHEVDVSGGQVSLIMELIHGVDVSQTMRRLSDLGERTMPLDQALAIVLGVCAGLHHAHEMLGTDGAPMQIVHRDVSPQNVVIGFDGSVKVIDFGIARARMRSSSQTQHGIVKGKPGYMSPEQLAGRVVDRRTDVWSAAVMLYRITTGQAAFNGIEVAVDPPRPSEVVEGYPPELEEIVLCGMRREITRRYQTAEELRVALEMFARSRGCDLSPFGIAAMMANAFPDERERARTGHVVVADATGSIDLDLGASEEALTTALPAPRSDVGTAPVLDLAAPAPARAPRRGLVALLVLAAFAIGGVVAWRALRADATDGATMANIGNAASDGSATGARTDGNGSGSAERRGVDGASTATAGSATAGSATAGSAATSGSAAAVASGSAVASGGVATGSANTAKSGSGAKSGKQRNGIHSTHPVQKPDPDAPLPR